MTVTEKVKETASDLRDDLKETVEHLRHEVAQLKDRVGQMVPFKKKDSVPVRHDPAALDPVLRSRSLLDDPWFDAAWPGRRLAHLLGSFDPGFGAGWPQVDVTENDREIRVRVELPGVDETDVDVQLGPETLTIRGEKSEEVEDRSRGHYRHECRYGSFVRTIPLPCEVVPDEVEASFKKGVLNVKLPKTKEARQRIRKIDVQTD